MRTHSKPFVCGGRRRFATVGEAHRYCALVFARTGVVIALEHRPHSEPLDLARRALEKAKAAYVAASVACPAHAISEAAHDAWRVYTRAAGRYALTLAEAGRDPREVEAFHCHGAGALIGKSGASAHRRHLAQAALRERKEAAAA